MIAAAGIKPEEIITCRPADLLEPELEKYRKEYAGVAKSDEDILSLALFPQVAPKFLAYRDGDHKEAAESGAAAGTSAAGAANGAAAAAGSTGAANGAKSNLAADGARELYVEFRGL